MDDLRRALEGNVSKVDEVDLTTFDNSTLSNETLRSSHRDVTLHNAVLRHDNLALMHKLKQAEAREAFWRDHASEMQTEAHFAHTKYNELKQDMSEVVAERDQSRNDAAHWFDQVKQYKKQEGEVKKAAADGIKKVRQERAQKVMEEKKKVAILKDAVNEYVKEAEDAGVGGYYFDPLKKAVRKAEEK